MLGSVRIGHHHHYHYLAARISGTGDIELFAADHPLITIQHGGCRNIGCIRRSYPGLCNGKGRSNLARQQRLKPLLLMLFRTVSLQYLHVTGIRCRAVKRLGGKPAPAHNFSQMGILQIADSGATLALRQKEIPQPHVSGSVFQAI